MDVSLAKNVLAPLVLITLVSAIDVRVQKKKKKKKKNVWMRNGIYNLSQKFWFHSTFKKYQKSKLLNFLNY